MHFSGDVSLWEHSTEVAWRSHNLCPPLSQFKVREITLAELYALSPAGTWVNVEKFKCYMAFLLIVPNKTVERERVFGLVPVWVHPFQAHHPSLGEVACKLRLLISTSNDWVYAFAQLNEGTLHMPLSSEGHINEMIDGAPSMTPCTSAN